MTQMNADYPSPPYRRFIVPIHYVLRMTCIPNLCSYVFICGCISSQPSPVGTGPRACPHTRRLGVVASYLCPLTSYVLYLWASTGHRPYTHGSPLNGLSQLYRIGGPVPTGDGYSSLAVASCTPLVAELPSLFLRITNTPTL